MRARWILSSLFIHAASGSFSPARAEEERKLFRAGADAIDITPRKFPVVVNAMFEERSASSANDPLHARCLVLDDGATRLAIAVVDSCMLPRDLIDEAKQLARQLTGIPVDRILVSATHTHSAPSAMGCLGSRPDPDYTRFLPGQIAQGIEAAAKNLEPARVGWKVVKAEEYTYNRRWIFRSDRVGLDPFGERTVRANMHPGHQSPDAIGPSGPVDPDLTLLSFESPGGRPIALLANFSMHYYGSPLLSADYYGRFAEKMAELVGVDPDSGKPPFVAIMSQGTSGDLMWMDYGQPRKEIGFEAYAESISRIAHDAFKKIEYRDWVPLAMRESRLSLRRRVPSEARLAWARKTAAGLGDRLPRTQPEIYALEQIYLHESPTAELKLQAIRVGALGIAAIPDEVFAITGLKIKAQSPLEPTMNIELANGSEGYIPPPEQHKLGGYTTWPARTAGLEVEAEPKILEAVLRLLEEVSGKRRSEVALAHGPAAKGVLASRPLAYWRLDEMMGPWAMDATGLGHKALYEEGVAFYLEGPRSRGFSGESMNRAPHLAGGRIRAEMELGPVYSVQLWFWSGFPADGKPVTGCLFSREEGKDGDAGDHLAIGGTQAAPGRLIFSSGGGGARALEGKTPIELKTWNHVALVRDGKKTTVYLNGAAAPEIAGEAPAANPSRDSRIFLGGRGDGLASFEGKIDEVAVYDRALSVEEVARQLEAASQ